MILHRDCLSREKQADRRGRLIWSLHKDCWQYACSSQPPVAYQAYCFSNNLPADAKMLLWSPALWHAWLLLLPLPLLLLLLLLCWGCGPKW